MQAVTRQTAPAAEREAALEYMKANLRELCREMVSFHETGLFGTGKLHELRKMCSFAGARAQDLSTNMVKRAAVDACAHGLASLP